MLFRSVDSMLKYLHCDVKKLLINLFNDFLRSNIFPPSWTFSIIIPIIKPGKNPDYGSSYRPIGLSSCLLKSFQHLFKNRLEWFIESQHIIPDFQFGFRKGKGTYDGLSLLLSNIQMAFSKNQITIALFLDITGAYDNVNIDILLRKLKKLNICPVYINCLASLLKERSIIVKYHNNLSAPRKIYKGLVQGSKLSPLLFSIFMYDFPQSNSEHVKIIQYADDICIFSSDKTISKALEHLNGIMRRVHIWLYDNELQLSYP